MSKHQPDISACEVIILTALPLEFHAVVAHLQDLQEVEHPQTGTIYQTGSFAGRHGDLRVAVAQIGMGGLSAASETERASNLFHPDIMFFVGIAGGLKDTRHGDVVVATKVYAYETGKADIYFKPRPELWHPSYALEQRARAEARKSDWLLGLNESSTTQSPQIFIGPLAAGEKVLSCQQSWLYHFLQTTYGDSLAVEMEGHGFLQALHANQAIHALVIRGISDLVEDKAVVDVSEGQQRAARHAAAFAFQVLATFALPGQKSASSVSSARFGAPFPDLWNVPRRHSPFFTGRDQILQHLFERFQIENDAGMISPQALNGLGGMGKTQTAAEYAYRFREQYQAVFWVRAENQENLLADFKTIAELLHRSQELLRDRSSLIHTLHKWFLHESGWLLIFDNVDDLALVDPFLPRAGRGHLLLTTRARATVEQAQALRLEPLALDDGALCILRRSGILLGNRQLQDASTTDVEAARHLSRLMDGLPVALEQAGAYINDTGCGVKRYLSLYPQYRAEIQAKRHGLLLPDYPVAVASTWSISRQAVKLQNAAAAELLFLCACLAPEAIPDDMVTISASVLGLVLGPIAANPLALDQAIGILLKYSLLQREDHYKTGLTSLSIHRMLQEILLDEMDTSARQYWAERAVLVVEQAFRQGMPWQTLQSHVYNCLSLIEQWQMTFPEARRLQQLAVEVLQKEN